MLVGVDGCGRSSVATWSDIAELQPIAADVMKSLLIALSSPQVIELWGAHGGCVLSGKRKLCSASNATD